LPVFKARKINSSFIPSKGSKDIIATGCSPSIITYPLIGNIEKLKLIDYLFPLY